MKLVKNSNKITLVISIACPKNMAAIEDVSMDGLRKDSGRISLSLETGRLVEGVFLCKRCNER